MIGKVPAQGKSFRGLIAYLMKGKKKEPTPERVAWTATHNLLVEDPKKAATLMRLTSQKSKRVKTPVYHYVISWRHDENPTDDFMREVADVTCRDLGLEEHQLLFVAHKDTDHHHVHIVANRVHPETGLAWKNSHDFRRIECSLRRQAEAYGMEFVPGRHNEPERFRGRSRGVTNGEWQRNRHLGLRDLPRSDEATRSRHRKLLQEIFAKAGSWEQLEAELDKRGLVIDSKGQGLVIGNESGVMKLSDVGRELRVAALEQRFGKAFKAHEEERRQKPRRERLPSKKADNLKQPSAEARQEPDREKPLAERPTEPERRSKEVPPPEREPGRPAPPPQPRWPRERVPLAGVVDRIGKAFKSHEEHRTKPQRENPRAEEFASRFEARDKRREELDREDQLLEQLLKKGQKPKKEPSPEEELERPKPSPQRRWPHETRPSAGLEEQLAKAAEAPEKEHRQEPPRENIPAEEFQNVKQASAEAESVLLSLPHGACQPGRGAAQF